jgi:hypothetical protein
MIEPPSIAHRPGPPGPSGPNAAAPRRARSLLTLLLIFAAAPVLADRLPLRSGGWIETSGPWHREGERIVYLSAEGRLRSLAASELGLAQPPGLPVGAIAAHRIAEYPSDRPILIPEPLPLPARPRPRRPTPPAPPGCVLANSVPGSSLAWRCVDPEPRAAVDPGRTVRPVRGSSARRAAGTP